MDVNKVEVFDSTGTLVTSSNVDEDVYFKGYYQ